MTPTTREYFATIDAAGRLRLHSGPVPYLLARSLAEAQERPRVGLCGRVGGPAALQGQEPRPVRGEPLMGPLTGGATDRLAAALGAAGPTLAAVLRSGLIGLGAALEVAVEAAPAETGAEACRALAADLRRLATSSVTEMAPLEEPRPLSPAPAALPAGEPLRLAGLVAELKADPRAAPILGPDDLEAAGQAASDAEAWGAVQRLLLRLPAAAAATWRARALACAGRAGARADESDAAFPGPGDTLPLDDGDEVIYPGLCGAIRRPRPPAPRGPPRSTPGSVSIGRDRCPTTWTGWPGSSRPRWRGSRPTRPCTTPWSRSPASA